MALYFGSVRAGKQCFLSWRRAITKVLPQTEEWLPDYFLGAVA